jgi:uncharacterized protein (DUF1684 family)
MGPPATRARRTSRRRPAGLALALSLAFAASTGCGGHGGGAPEPPASPLVAGHGDAAGDYASQVHGARREKEIFFRDSPQSPAPASLRSTLAPLEYYPIDPSWRLTLPLRKDPRRPRLRIVTSSGELRRIVREGTVTFSREGRTLSLALYREEDQPSEGGYWVPFVDAAAGRETYPAGRYLDVRPEVDGRVVLDFNYAYNPYCAYGWNYSCPMAPPENRLPIVVAAGEKGFHRAGA